MRRLLAVMILGALLPLGLADPAPAQQAPPSAELKRVIGRVEILRKGQTQWIPAVIGARLVEGDDIRAFSGAQAELAMPDASTVQLAENSRLLLTKLEYDQQQQSRLVLLHLVVGKVRAAIAQTAITLVRTRQSNFGISTPTAVAAARGTIVWVYFDGATLIAVEPEPGLRIQPRIECITVATPQPKRQMVLAGYATTNCGPTAAIPPQFLTLSNPANAATAALLNAAVVSVPGNIEQLVTGIGDLQAGAPVSFSAEGGPLGFGSPATFGNDAVSNASLLNSPPPNPLPFCASPGGNQENCQPPSGQQ
jgi:hypothetical protein